MTNSTHTWDHTGPSISGDVGNELITGDGCWLEYTGTKYKVHSGKPIGVNPWIELTATMHSKESLSADHIQFGNFLNTPGAEYGVRIGTEDMRGGRANWHDYAIGSSNFVHIRYDGDKKLYVEVYR